MVEPLVRATERGTTTTSNSDRTGFDADLLAWQESEEAQAWQTMAAEELAEDLAAAAANDRALREAPETGFATMAELVAFEMAA